MSRPPAGPEAIFRWGAPNPIRRFLGAAAEAGLGSLGRQAGSGFVGTGATPALRWPGSRQHGRPHLIVFQRHGPLILAFSDATRKLRQNDPPHEGGPIHRRTKAGRTTSRVRTINSSTGSAVARVEGTSGERTLRTGIWDIVAWPGRWLARSKRTSPHE